MELLSFYMICVNQEFSSGIGTARSALSGFSSLCSESQIDIGSSSNSI